jgi:hypothetical protein
MIFNRQDALHKAATAPVSAEFGAKFREARHSGH